MHIRPPSQPGNEIDLEIALRKIHELAMSDGDIGYAYWNEIGRILRQAAGMQDEINALNKELERGRSSTQEYLRETIRVIHAAADISGDVEKAIDWFKNERLDAFDYETPQMLVSEGRTCDLLRYIQSLDAGFSG
jgi:hypothetical protein